MYVSLTNFKLMFKIFHFNSCKGHNFQQAITTVLESYKYHFLSEVNETQI